MSTERNQSTVFLKVANELFKAWGEAKLDRWWHTKRRELGGVTPWDALWHHQGLDAVEMLAEFDLEKGGEQ